MEINKKLKLKELNKISNYINKLLYLGVEVSDYENAIIHDNLTLNKLKKYKLRKLKTLKEVSECKKIVKKLILINLKNFNKENQINFEKRLVIPNYNSFSTILDRLSIENVKLFHFQKNMKNLISTEEINKNIKLQRMIIIELKKILADFLMNILLSKNYEFIKEERTFK